LDKNKSGTWTTSFSCKCARILENLKTTMNINRETLRELQKLQEDIAEYFADENFPISGETYWTCIQCLAEAKLAELRGELSYN